MQHIQLLKAPFLEIYFTVFLNARSGMLFRLLSSKTPSSSIAATNRRPYCVCQSDSAKPACAAQAPFEDPGIAAGWRLAGGLSSFFFYF